MVITPATRVAQSPTAGLLVAARGVVSGRHWGQMQQIGDFVPHCTTPQKVRSYISVETIFENFQAAEAQEQ